MRREVVDQKRRDDKFQALKRRVTMLARLDGELVLLAEGPFLVRISAREPRNAKAIVAHLLAHGVLDRATLERNIKLEGPPLAIDTHVIAAAHRDVRALSQRPMLDLAHEHRRALARHGIIDEAWLRRKTERIQQVNALLATAPRHERAQRTKEEWFDSIVELVHAMRGETEARALTAAAARVHARPAERRREAHERIDVLVLSLLSGEPPVDPELAGLAERLDSARELPGRARRRRVLDVLRHAVAWPTAPVELVMPALGAQELGAEYPALVEEAGRAMASALPSVRDPSVRQRSLELLAHLGLLFPIGDDRIPTPDETETAETLAKLGELTELAAAGLSLAQSLALVKIPMIRSTRLRVARWVKEGLELELVAEAAEKKHIENLVQVPDIRAARAYATWATRLSAHYESRGIAFSLSPELFANLPKNEDLAVLAMCLMEHVDPKNDAKVPTDPIAVLDSTLALFQKLPTKARGILGSLRGSDRGEGRRLFPELAEWLDDDAALDRLVHVAQLAGEPPLSSATREDFEHASRTSRERAHLEKLTTRSAPQQGRLDALLRAERTLAGSPKGRTRRRVAQRIDQLLPKAYRRELDATFREILREAWGIAVPSLTPAWRDAVRFWLVVDDNRALLGQLLKEASLEPGRDVKRAFPKNAVWIEAARSRLDVDAWLAPRRKEVRVDTSPGTSLVPTTTLTKKRSSTFTIVVEEDPLEVLRMGIPFGTCLALETGCNAASTVLNAIEANKRVIYVRNASGRVVARKLLAISKDARLIGYNLYVSVNDRVEELAIRTAVLELCQEIARDVGIPLSGVGVPVQLHQGFWYDDGTVPFDEDVDVAAYCKSLGLPPPPKWYEELGQEARGWRACETGDVESAIAVLATYDTGPANRGLGAWIVERLGARAATLRGAEDASVFIALTRALADEGEYGMIRALEIATRMPERVVQHRVHPLLARFPPSPRLGVALVDMGLRALRRHPKTGDHGLPYLTLAELPATFDDVASALDLLDSIEPVWLELRRLLPNCAAWVDSAETRSANIVEAIFDRVPDPDVVVAALMSRHRTITAQRAALRVAARHVLPGGDRALVRLATLRPELAVSPNGVAALVRQAEADRVTDALARRLPGRSSLPRFEALRELLVRCEGIELLLPDAGRVADIDLWSPGPWELAWRRRRSDPELSDGLFARAARAPRRATRPMELLALLGDLRRVGALDHVAPLSTRKISEGATPSKASIHDSPLACRRTAVSIAEQVQAERRGRVDPDVRATPHADAAYVDLARRALLAESTDAPTRDAARNIVLDCSERTVVDWERLLAASVRDRIDATTARRILEEKVNSRLSPRVVVDAWQLPEAREALARAIAAQKDPNWCARVWAAEREAKARGLSVEGLLEKIALGLLALKEYDDPTEAETLDQLRSILGTIVAEAPAADVAQVYDYLEDTVAVATFLRAFRRQPTARAAELREAAKKLDFSTDRDRALEAWLDSTRSSSSSAPVSQRLGIPARPPV